jgi:hypothetical protein
MMNFIHNFVKNNIPRLEMAGVIMRIFCFTLVSWLGPASPFMLVWVVNTVDAVLLTYCAMLKKDRAYTLLNSFWILVGIVGIARAGGWI